MGLRGTRTLNNKELPSQENVLFSVVNLQLIKPRCRWWVFLANYM